MRIAQTEKTLAGADEITGFSQIGQQNWDGQSPGPIKSMSFSLEELLAFTSEEGVIEIDNILIDKAALESLGLSQDDRVWFYQYLTADGEEMIIVTWSANDVEGILNTFRQVLIIIAPAALIVAGILGFFYVKRALRPVQAMTQTAREIEDKNLAKRLDISGKDELGQLASTLNRMLTRLEEAFKREKQFTADASHELRSPLGIIQGEATLALKKDRNPEEYRKSLEAIAKETENMSSILKKLLFLARNEDNKRLDFEKVNLKKLLTELADPIELLCEDKSLNFQIDAKEDLIVKGDEVSLRELYINLLNNAIQYTPRGGTITVTLTHAGNNARVTVKDTGIGIPEEHIKHIFERFYRVDKSRSRSEGNIGLGLSICQRIVELHGGKMEVESKVGVGSTFTVLMPQVEGG